MSVPPPLVFGVLFCLLLWFCFVVCLFLSFRPDKTSDCVMVRTSLSTPQRGIQNMHLGNSFISTTMCDDLARATEAQDGKKQFTMTIFYSFYVNIRTNEVKTLFLPRTSFSFFCLTALVATRRRRFVISLRS